MGVRAVSNFIGKRSGHRMPGPSLSLTAQVTALITSFSGPKVWYDPRDISTLQQDSAGLVPVTTAGQPIGRIMDKSGAANHATQLVPTSLPLWQTTYASFDGVDDSWATSSIDFTSTDKLTIIWGIRVSTGVATQMLLEQGPVFSGATGRFYISLNELAAGGFLFTRASSVGPLVNQLRNEGAQTVPRTTVMSVASDFAVAPPSTGIIMRSNGVLSGGTSAGTPGTSLGYANDALFIGRRNNTSLPFNGNLYGLIIIGRQLTATELALCEQYMAQQTGIVI